MFESGGGAEETWDQAINPNSPISIKLSNTKSGMQLIRAVPYRSSYPGGSGVAHPKQTSVNQSIIRR